MPRSVLLDLFLVYHLILSFSSTSTQQFACFRFEIFYVKFLHHSSGQNLTLTLRIRPVSLILRNF